jgi:hypothetical protein
MRAKYWNLQDATPTELFLLASCPLCLCGEKPLGALAQFNGIDVVPSRHPPPDSSIPQTAISPARNCRKQKTDRDAFAAIEEIVL